MAWLIADPTVRMIDVLPDEAQKSCDERYERPFCPRNDVYVVFSTRSKRKIVTICQYPLNVGFSVDLQGLYGLTRPL
jgi:hypothetical protein